MILLDTHVWLWWVHGDSRLPAEIDARLHCASPGTLFISAISLWEVAKLVERGRLELPMPIDEWMVMATGGSGVTILPLTPEIALRSTRLGEAFHRDPADQLIVATSHVHAIALATCDGKIRGYIDVALVEPMTIHDGS